MDFWQRTTPTNGRRIVLVVFLAILECSAAAGNTVGSFKSCNNNKGICVKNEQCINGQLDTVGEHIILPRTGVDSTEECSAFDEICCERPKPKFDSDESDELTAFLGESDEPESRQCGQRANVPFPDEEYETNRFEFPWNVALFTHNVFLCGGTLIDNDVVITAARCVLGLEPTSLRVVLGSIDLLHTNRPGVQDIAVERVIVHSEYVATSRKHNIALIILSNTVQLGRAVNRVCLADSSLKLDELLCYVVGWSNTPTDENRQLKLRSTIASGQECTAAIRRVTNNSKFQFPKHDICTQFDQDAPCERAPGSGLVCESTLTESHYFLVGIASYSLRNCSRFNVNDVFLKIPDYIAWIDSHMQQNNFGTTYYRPNPAISEDMCIT
uniref:Peptidase S1 domain-containing protein n=1 Tax=Anopheles culicifacies TaxID=139723 RepID=A0A182M7U5_9DIPT